MSTNRRSPEELPEPPLRRPSDTVHAIDAAVTAAAAEVERRLEADGIKEQRVTPRDVLRSRHPRDTFDDEAITEPISDDVLFAPRAAGNGGGRAPSEASSLSPFAVDPREGRAPAPVGPRPDSRARPVARSASGARARPGLLARARTASWTVALFLLGAFTAFVAVVALRSPGHGLFEPARRAVGAGGTPTTADAGPARAADAAASLPSAPASLGR